MLYNDIIIIIPFIKLIIKITLFKDLQGIEEFRLRFTSLTKSPGKSRCVTFKLNYTSQLPPNIMVIL